MAWTPVVNVRWYSQYNQDCMITIPHVNYTVYYGENRLLKPYHVYLSCDENNITLFDFKEINNLPNHTINNMIAKGEDFGS